MNKQSVWVRILAGFGAFALCLSLLLTSLFSVSYDLRFYQSEYDKLGQAEEIGVTRETLTSITQRVVAYLKGTVPDLDMQAEIQGEVQEVFGSREKAHMEDVLGLFKLGRCVQWIGFLVFAACMALSLLLFNGSFRKRLSAYGLSCLFGCGAFILALGILAAIIAVDFDAAFIRFHLMFFSNDLWLLNPETDVLIQMVPEQFFMDCVARIAVIAALFLFAMVLLFAGLFLLGFLSGRNDRKTRTQTEEIFSALGLDDQEETDRIGDVPYPKGGERKDSEEISLSTQSIELPIRVDSITGGQGVILQLRMEMHLVRDGQAARLELIPGSVPQVQITPRGEQKQEYVAPPAYASLSQPSVQNVDAEQLKMRLQSLLGDDRKKGTDNWENPDIAEGQIGMDLDTEEPSPAVPADSPVRNEAENTGIQEQTEERNDSDSGY